MLSTWRGREADWLVGWCRFGRQVDSSVALPLRAGFLALKKWAREGGQDPPGFADHSGDRGAVTMPKNLREGFEGQVFVPFAVRRLIMWKDTPGMLKLKGASLSMRFQVVPGKF